MKPHTDVPPREEPRELRSELMVLNVGPQHPSTHGVLRVVVTLAGEEIVDLVPHIGYLHSGFEKTMEHRTYTQNFTYTPRMDYVHSFAHDLAYALTVEKLVGVQVPERAETIRIILNELSRIASHLIFVATGLLDLGAMTPFFYAFREREAILDLFEWVTGQRFHHNYLRVGGLKEDVPEEFVPELKKFLSGFLAKVDDYQGMFDGSPIFASRARDIGVIPPEVAINLGLTGGSLRASGVNYDVRKAHPYGGYDKYDFDVPLGTRGDVYDRMIVRLEEMRQSHRILEQAVQRLEPGPIRDPNPHLSLPPREMLGRSMEALIFHFKLVTEGFHPPLGEVYVPTESARGELAYYIVSDGGSMPYRVKIRTPEFVNIQSLAYASKGHQFADFIAILATLDPVLGGIDR
ncbi:NADH dehydrogenase (quinone) subunit D [Deinococcota bacterium DY0809b]